MSLATIEERADSAATTLGRFLKNAQRDHKRTHIYGIFYGDLMLNWTLSRVTALKLARNSWIKLSCQLIGSI